MKQPQAIFSEALQQLILFDGSYLSPREDAFPSNLPSWQSQLLSQFSTPILRPDVVGMGLITSNLHYQQSEEIENALYSQTTSSI